MPHTKIELLKQARQLSQALSEAGPADADGRQRLYTQLRDVAVAAGDLVLEAEALLGLGPDQTPVAHPQQVLAQMERAGQIFFANGRTERVHACRLAAASALCDAGEESEAQAWAGQALRSGELTAAQEVQAHLVIAKAQLQLGNIDATLQQVAHAMPLAGTLGDHCLLGRLLHSQALARLFLLIANEMPALWYPLPGQPPLQAAPTPACASILALLDQADAALGQGPLRRYIDLARALTQVLFLRDAAALDRMVALSVDTLVSDAPLALRAMLCLSLVRRHEGRDRDALGMLGPGLVLAQQLGLSALARSIHLHEAHAREQLGDTQGALNAFRQHSKLVVQSLQRRACTDTGPLREAATDTPPPPMRTETLRHKPEPVCVQRALRYIEDQLLEPIRVADIAAHCGVSRRTLETTFKAYKASTIADFIASQRVSQAAQALRYTDRPGKDIAASIGYRSASAFSREFQSRLGLLPTQWRRARQAQDAQTPKPANE